MTHYSLDIDVLSLTAAARKLADLETGLGPGDEGGRLRHLSGNRGPWSGRAATACFAEMVRLGDAMIAASAKAGSARAAVESFARAAETAMTATLPSLNRRWEAADTAYDSSVSRASAVYRSETRQARNLPPDDQDELRDDAVRTRDRAIDSAAAARFRTRERIDADYDAMVTGLQAAARTLAAGLTAAMPIPFSDAEWSAVRGGTIPPGMLVALRQSALGAGSFADTAGQTELGKSLAKQFNDGPGSGNATPEEIRAYLAQLNVDSEAFRYAFLTNLDLGRFTLLQDISHQLGSKEAQAIGQLVTAVATMMAKASNPVTQPNHPMPAGWYQDLIKSYTSYGLTPGIEKYDAAGTIRAKGYLLLAELMQAGQGSAATWDPALIAQVASQTVAFERTMAKTNTMFSWGQVYGTANGTWPTEAGRSLVGTIPGRIDAVSMLFDALSHDRTAALKAVTTSSGTADLDMLHYLYDGRGSAQGSFFVWQDVLGSALYAATNHVGAGGPGSENYASAEIVSDLVHYYATHPNLADGNITFAPHLADILTTHIQAVNHSGIDFAGTVAEGVPSGLLLYNRIDLAVLSNQDLDAVMRMMFGMDYWSHKVDPTKGYPLYGQLQAASDAAYRLDFLEITSTYHGDTTMLKKLAQEMGIRRGDTVAALADSLRAAGLSEDAANKEAQKALDWVLGLGMDKLVSKTGVGGLPGMAIGFGADQVKSWLVNSLIPDTSYGPSAARDGAALQKWAYSGGALQLIQWLDESGLKSGAPLSPQTWAAKYPDQASFMVGDRLPDLANLYAAGHAADASPAAKKQWDDFVRYYDQYGNRWMIEWGVADSYVIGALASRTGLTK